MLDVLRRWLFPSACVACDAPGPGYCGACRPAPADAVRFAVGGIAAYAAGPYDGALRRAVVAMKRGVRDPLDAFVELLADAPLHGALVPVPTTRLRAAERGFDQSVELARRLAAARGVPYAAVLRKRGRPQAGRRRAERLAARGRFRVVPGAALPAVATLLDDVCTTGATLVDAAATLRAAGTRVACIVVLARRGTGGAGENEASCRISKSTFPRASTLP